MSLRSRLDTGKLWLACGALSLTLFLFLNRSIFSTAFDAPSLLHLFERSQWSIPASSRIMADAELYQVSGYDLWHGGSPFDINPETPPLGKYLYGASIVAFNNPYWAAVGFFMIAAGLFWLLAREVWKETAPRLIAFGLFLSTPPLLMQMSQTMLDMPQLIGILLHVLAIVKLSRTNGKLTYLWAAVAGVGLGIFMGAKIGVFGPAIALASLALIPISSWPLFVIMGAFTILTYLLSYLPAFVQGLSLLDWLRNQKWIATFYASSKLPRLPWAAPAYLLTGFFSQSGKDAPRWITDWTPLWPLTLGAAVNLARRWKTLEPVWRYFLVLTALVGLMLIISPFFPRYILDIAPFLILFLAQWLWKAPWRANAALGFLSLGWALWTFTAQPQSLTDHLEDRWEAGAHEEVYNLLSPLDRLAMTRETFVYAQKDIDRQLQTSHTEITVEVPSTAVWTSHITGQITVERTTPLGLLTTQHELPMIRENGRWRIDWDWNMTLPHATPQAEVRLELEKPTFGNLQSKELEQLSTGGTRPFLTVYPSNIQDGEVFIRDIAPLLGQSGTQLRNKIYVLGEGLGSIPLGFVLEGTDATIIEELRHHPALSVEDRPARVHQSRFILPDGSNLLEEIEKQHPELEPQFGGRAYVRWSDGQTFELLSSPGKPGFDVTIEQTAAEILSASKK